MILILVVALFSFGDCTGEGAASGVYGDYSDVVDNLKNVGKYEQQKYSINIKGDEDKKDNLGYQEQYREYDGGQKYEDQKEYNDYRDNFRDDEKWNREGYEGYDDERKFDKYDGPKDFIISDKYRDDKDRFDIREYDYIVKCDIKEKDCKDGKDCYDNAKNRDGYDKCREQYGTEDRFFDETDRSSGNRYRYDNDRDRYGYEKDCYDNSKDRDEYKSCLDRYDNDKDSDGYEKNCYDNTKDRNDYDKCRRYYRRCRDYYNRRDSRYSYNEQDWRNDKDCYYDQVNLVGLGKNDREDQLIRPCATDDRQCIRKYLARNSKCTPAYGPIPDPLYLKRNTVYLSYANITLIRTGLRMTGLASIKIREFYVNKDTGNLVIALDFTNLNETSQRAYFRFRRTGKESIVLSDYATVEFKSGTFTAVIPKIPHLRLDLAEVHADINEPIPAFFIGPKAADSKDPDVVAGFATFLAGIPIAVQESFLFLSQLYTAIYIQENLCDFGLKLISV